MVTLVGLLLSIVTAVVLACGYIVAGGVLVLFAGIFDMFDGAMARVRNEATTFGAFLDSTLDRYSESIILGGLLFYASQRPELQDSLWPFPYEQQWMVGAIYVAVVGSLMVSYAKARAEGLGLECKTGLLARPERVVILAIGLLFNVTIWVLVLLAVLSHVTAIERILYVWRVADRSEERKNVRTGSKETPAQEAESVTLEQGTLTETNIQRESSVGSVSTSLQPLAGSIQQD